MIPLQPERRTERLSCSVASVLLIPAVSSAHRRALETVILQSMGIAFIACKEGKGVFKSLVNGSDERKRAHALLNSPYSNSRLENNKCVALSVYRSSKTGEAMSPCKDGFITLICFTYDFSSFKQNGLPGMPYFSSASLNLCI